jgi:hypothetical protein
VITGRISTDKCGCIDWSGHFRAARRKITNPRNAPSLALMMGVHRHDKPLKFWLHNSCTNAPKQWLSYNGLANSRFHTLLFGINRLRSDTIFTCRRLPLAQAFKVGIRDLGCLGLP